MKGLGTQSNVGQELFFSGLADFPPPGPVSVGLPGHDQLQ